VCVARDTRPSGEELAAAVVTGAVAAGAQVLDAGVLPTSGACLAVADGAADVAVVVTASHNQASDNGFKVVGPGAHKLDEAQVERFEAWLAEPPLRRDGGTSAECASEAWARWERRVEAALPSLEVFRGRKLAVDLAHGAASGAADWLIRHVPAVWTVIGAGDGIVNDGVGSEHLEAVGAAVRAHGCEAGLAVDGDADRCRLVDEHGEVVPGDAVTWLLATSRAAEGIAVTVMSNGALERCLPGVEVVRTPVGDRHLRVAMDARGLPLGAEESGHVLFGDFPAGDGLLAGLIALAAGLGQGIGAATSGYVPLARRLGKVRVQARPELDTVIPLRDTVAAHEPALGEFGRIFLRYSGTEPVLRVLVEGDERVAVDRVFEAVTAVAEEHLI